MTNQRDGSMSKDLIDFSDQKVRELFLKSGFNVDVPSEVDAFARFIRASFVEYDNQTRTRDTRRMVLISLGVGLTTTLVPIILKLLKVI